MTLEELIQELSTYSQGDLVAAVQLLEAVEELLKDTKLSDSQKETLAEIRSFLESEVVSDEHGDKKGWDTLISKLDTKKQKKAPKKEKGSSSSQDIEVITSFITESVEHLEDIERKILALETEADSEELHAIFRSMHTIKGVASFIGFEKIKQLSHVMESILDSLRMQELQPSTAVIDLLLEGVDNLNQLIGGIDQQVHKTAGKASAQLIQEPPIPVDDLLARLESCLAVKPAKSAGNEGPSSQNDSERGNVDDLITRDMLEKFVNETSDFLDNAETDILAIENASDPKQLIDQAFRTVHTIKGNAGFFWQTELESMCMSMETVLDSLRKGSRKVDNAVVTVLLNGIDGARKQLEGITKDTKSVSWEQDAAGQVSVKEEETDQPASAEARPLGQILLEMGAVEEADIETALSQQRMPIGEILLQEGVVSQENLEKALTTQGPAVTDDVEKLTQYTVKRKDIRVDTARLDRLFDLMGELITAEAMLIGDPKLQELQIDSVNKAASNLSKITRELQEITMTIRMIPLDGLFNKMRRLVRDLSRKFEKKVNLAISGEETEMDRNVIEEIADPLVHIIRNAIDHGIEDQKKRKISGKDQTGTIKLQAKYEGNEIWITISDDGAGLNREGILDKAVQRNLISADARDTISDEEIYSLIFEPGFSTAAKLSEISGRGVGMDVVKKNIEKLRGKVEVTSEQGKGTHITMKIPLTLAIVDAVTVRVGQMLYCIPIDDVSRFHKQTASQITETKGGREVLNLRGELIPLVRLSKFYGFQEEDNERELAVVVQNADHKIALMVDQIISYQQVVVKALPEYLDGMRATSGCSIMGDGSVCLILDTGSLIKEVLE